MRRTDYEQFRQQLRAMLIVFAAICAILCAVACFGAAPRARDAVDLVHADLLDLRNQGLNTQATAYVWCRSAGSESTALVSFIANSVISRTALNFPPDEAGSPIETIDGGSIIRLDLAGLAPGSTHFKEIAETWDKMREPQLYLSGIEIVDGKTVIPLFGPHVDVTKGAEIQALTGRAIPLVSLESLAVNTLQTADGGLYYQFMGIKKSTQQGLSDRDAWLKSKGIDINVIEARRSAQRAALVTSAVTGKVRVVEIFNGSSRLGSNQGIVSVTYDPFDESVTDPNFDPFLHLLSFQFDGEEIIFELQNGHLGYVLFDANGNLVNEAPPNLVVDHEIPRPYTRRLQPAISCIRCHSKPGEDGWKPFSNEIRDLMASFISVADDVNKGSVPEAIEHVARLYAGRLDKPIRRAREDHSDAIVECVGDATREDGTPWQFEDVGAALADLFSQQLYTPVDAARACRELGYDPGQNPAQQLGVLLGQPVDGSEDVRLALLLIGKAINRAQWDLVYVDAASRAALTQQGSEK